MSDAKVTTGSALNALLVLLDETRDTVGEIRDTYQAGATGVKIGEGFLVTQAITTVHQSLTVLSRFVGKAAGLADTGRLDDLAAHLGDHERFVSWRKLHPAVDAASARAERVIDQTPPESVVGIARDERHSR